MLAEFTYGAVPKETFGAFLDQAKPRRAFYHLKKVCRAIFSARNISSDRLTRTSSPLHTGTGWSRANGSATGVSSVPSMSKTVTCYAVIK